MNREEVIDVLSVVAAATRRTVGNADVDVWEAVIGELPYDLALRGVRDHLKHKPGVWLEPGHVFEGAKAIRRDELARESIEAKAARQEALDARLAEKVEEIGAAMTVEPLRPRREAWRRLRCDHCKAGPGQSCRDPHTGQPLTKSLAHPSRIEKADTHASRLVSPWVQAGAR